MTRYFDFDQDDVKVEEQQPDTEITLGWGTIAGIVAALLVICGLCFGLGYKVGHRRPALAAQVAQTAAPDQEPLEGNSSVPKPTASDQAAVPPPEPSNATPPTAAEGGDASSSVPEATAAAPQPGLQPQPTTTLQSAQSQMRPALGGINTDMAQADAVQGVRTAPPSSETLMVQVAAVKHAEDANVLTDALRKRAYPVSQQRDPADGLIHVRVGPFNNRDEANRWRMKLLNDGYNAVVQP